MPWLSKIFRLKKCKTYFSLCKGTFKKNKKNKRRQEATLLSKINLFLKKIKCKKESYTKSHSRVRSRKVSSRKGCRRRKRSKRNWRDWVCLRRIRMMKASFPRYSIKVH